MTNTIIHIGAPRTGTTTIQNHLFQQARKTLVLSKIGYNPSSLNVNETFKIPNSNSARETRKENSCQNLYEEIIISSLRLSVNRESEVHRKNLKQAAHKALKKITPPSNQMIISTERLIDTSTSLNGDSIPRENTEKEFPIHPLCQELSEALPHKPMVTICLRDPIQYLRSKYLRTYFHRKALKELRSISPTEFIEKQSKLETTHSGTSALTPAMHAEFVKQLQKHAFVKAFGFQELLASDDVFSLMGLQGEEKYAFRDFPRENKLPCTKEQEQAIEIEITQALKKYGFYDQIMRAQMFE